MMLTLNLNGETRTLDLEDGSIPLIWVIRDILDLKGTKFGCGKAACGACTILIDGEAVRCCSYPAQLAEGKEIITIEGLGTKANPHPVQQAWVEEIVPQCGYCQPGFMMASAALLNKVPEPKDEDIDRTITNICRCGTYCRIRTAIHRAAEIQANASHEETNNVGS